MPTTKRSTPRVNKLSFISFVSREGGEQSSPVSMGRTLNISTAGLGIEIFTEILVGEVMEMEVALGDEIIPLRGRVVHSHGLESGGFYVGIEFDHPEERLAGVTLGED